MEHKTCRWCSGSFGEEPDPIYDPQTDQVGSTWHSRDSCDFCEGVLCDPVRRSETSYEGRRMVQGEEAPTFRRHVRELSQGLLPRADVDEWLRLGLRG
jgi:hypothetical protein